MLKLVTYKGTPICGIKPADGGHTLYLVGTIDDLIAAELISIDRPSVPEANELWLCVRVDGNAGKRAAVGHVSLVDALRAVETETDDQFSWCDVSEKIVKMAFGRFSDYRLV